ncbi:NADP-dependent malic enzyme [Bartonella sp. TP]|uniref:NADP-dependent malic enzyme n=1 Tax=Bartonella sp. TP TaxID=3057550 RepID=UPI0025B1E17F|nr:NADP-dependent malic enzyme [Bartonella sp. TP]WJW80077.1 NADP-dependent malic enzyme [Bartonella sp. TP]
MSDDNLREAALYYHSHPKPGKLEIQSTKALGSQRDLALAYSPGVAAPCLAISEDPHAAALYTSRANLVAVISNGSAVLGLGNIGPLASKPVMEGKAVLFKKFADIDVFDIEIAAETIDAMVETITNLEPTFGGINLEDIKAPECFEVEERLRAKLKIPVFHDDQHGTAIIVAAAIINGLELAGKTLTNAKIVTSGGGAAAIACLNLLLRLGAQQKNIWITDLQGVVYKDRPELMDKWKIVYAQDTEARSLSDIMPNADIFLGLSAANVLSEENVAKMAPKPLILALANPTPEIMPEKARHARPDAMICTGRSDYPNQVNNVLCFPYIFRGALDVGATTINEEMKIAAVYAIAKLAKESMPDAQAWSNEKMRFGVDYLIPSPFDPRLLLHIAPAVAQAAMESGVALRPISDMSAYIENLQRFVFKSGMVMKPVFAAAKTASAKRVIYSDGEDERVLRAAKVVSEEKIALPILTGRKDVILEKMAHIGVKLKLERDFIVYNPEENKNYKRYVELFVQLSGRRGITEEAAKKAVRTSSTIFSALALMNNDADAMMCGLSGQFERSLEIVKKVIGIDSQAKRLSALSLLIMRDNILFLTDSYINPEPTAQEIAELAILAAQEVQEFCIKPRVALLSNSNFGSKDNASSLKMRKAAEILKEIAPDLEADGEMHGDTALSTALRQRAYPHSTLQQDANLLVFPNLDAANITLNVVKQTTNALHVGPILLGQARAVHILTPSITSRGVVNMTAIAVVGANRKKTASD